MPTKNINDPEAKAAIALALGLDNPDSLTDFFYTKEQIDSLLDGTFEKDGLLYQLTYTSRAVPTPKNLILYSEELDRTTAWNAYHVAITPNQGLDLDGNNTLESIVPTDNSNQILRLVSSITVVAGLEYTLSFDAKKSSDLAYAKWSVYDVDHDTFPVEKVSFFSQLSETVSRVSLKFTVPTGCTSINIYLVADNQNQDLTGTLYIGRVQLDDTGSKYIKTTDTPVQ